MPKGVQTHCQGFGVIEHEELETLSIAHVDCDAFFASVEKRDNPELKHLPVIVGGGDRGVVAAACYVARTYGIRSAMPSFQARRLCPHLVAVKPRFEAYAEASRKVRDAMEALTPLVQPVSIDEAFLDLSGTHRLHGRSPAASLIGLQRQIEREVGVTVSVGLSHNKSLAKMASDLDKPRGFAVIGEEETLRFLADKPVTFIHGVGKSFAAKLNRDGIETIGDVQKLTLRDLVDRYGEGGLRLHARAMGRDPRPVRVEREVKSISGETTFSDDLRDQAALEDKLWGMCRKVSQRAKDKGYAGLVVTLKLKTSTFRSFTRRKTLGIATNLAEVLFEEGRALLREELKGGSRTAYRLIGIGISDLVAADGARMDLAYPEEHEKLERRESAVDALRAKFGADVIGTMRDRRTTKR
ncbi:DNA polymerase IV [Parvularcula sp. ZS-1/3]|uniref:DNA polymerase IV n=1 Tax=Parvularcula mediterranea TaxID=2732508 RepID=A0A7Y3W5W1_9PROT|nr:DNA polymerase IV [Parvularcula mediterranea]